MRDLLRRARVDIHHGHGRAGLAQRVAEGAPDALPAACTHMAAPPPHMRRHARQWYDSGELCWPQCSRKPAEGVRAQPGVPVTSATWLFSFRRCRMLLWPAPVATSSASAEPVRLQASFTLCGARMCDTEGMNWFHASHFPLMIS